MKKSLQATVFAMLLALASVPAWALGLGQLQLKSKLGQPLLAEIPVVSADPQELQNLQARLASPDTFLRIGLPLPDRMVSDLRFELAYDAANRPVIRVTSPVPVTMPMLTFLLEVDWGEGRLVREYSVLLAAPEAVAAASQPVIDAPQTAPSNTIVRDAEPVATTPMPAAAPVAPAPQPMPAPVAPAPQPMPAPAPVASAAPPPASAPTAQGSVEVRRGDTLSALAANAGMRGAQGVAWMAAMVRANPDAFIQGNANRLRSGARLVLPDAEAIAQADRDGSADALRAQLGGGVRGATAVDIANEPASAPPPATSARQATARPRIRRDARLQITPAVAAANAAQAGNRSGTGGEGDGEMTQQLQEARETIATRDAEVAELKSRVSELEGLQKQQAQLIQMKDGQLASVQQQLQQRQQQAAQNAPASSAGALWGWLGLVAALLLVAGLVAWMLRRRSRSRARPIAADATPGFARHSPPNAPVVPDPVETEVEDDGPAKVPAFVPVAPAAASAALFPNTPPASQPSPGESWSSNAASSLRKPSWIAPGTSAAAETASTEPHADETPEPQPSPESSVPKWLGRRDGLAPPQAPALTPGQGVFDPPAHEDARVEASSIDAESAERVALARTYIELGDENTARMLLQQVIDRGGPQAVIARRLLDGELSA